MRKAIIQWLQVAWLPKPDISPSPMSWRTWWRKQRHAQHPSQEAGGPCIVATLSLFSSWIISSTELAPHLHQYSRISRVLAVPGHGAVSGQGPVLALSRREVKSEEPDPGPARPAHDNASLQHNIHLQKLALLCQSAQGC